MVNKPLLIALYAASFGAQAWGATLVVLEGLDARTRWQEFSNDLAAEVSAPWHPADAVHQDRYGVSRRETVRVARAVRDLLTFNARRTWTAAVLLGAGLILGSLADVFAVLL